MAAEEDEAATEATAAENECEMLFCDNGWVEIRNPDDADNQWLLADTSAEVRQ